MSTVKAKSEVLPAPESESKPLPLPGTRPAHSKITALEDIPRFEQMVGRRFVKRDGSTNGEVYIPRSITPFWIMGADDMGDGDGNCPFTARFYVEKSRNGGEAEPVVTQIVLGREVRARAQVNSFFMDCSRFCDEYQESHE